MKDELTDDQYGRLDQYINGQVVGGRVNVDTIVDNLPGGEEVKQRFAEALASSLPDREFDTDSATAEKLVKRRRFRGDNGLHLTVPGSFYQDMVDVKTPAGPDGEFVITIHTKEWTER